MKLFKQISLTLVVIMVGIYACKNTSPTPSLEKRPTPTLIDYSASPWKTEFSYYLTEGDTCQMALQQNTVYVWYSEQDGGILVNVKIQH